MRGEVKEVVVILFLDRGKCEVGGRRSAHLHEAKALAALDDRLLGDVNDIGGQPDPFGLLHGDEVVLSASAGVD